MYNYIKLIRLKIASEVLYVDPVLGPIALNALKQADVHFFFIDTRSELTEFGHGRKVFALKFHPFDDNVFITGGWDKCIKVRVMFSPFSKVRLKHGNM